MQSSDQGGAAEASVLHARRLPSTLCWLLLLLGFAVSLAPQLGCRSSQTADGAGGQSGDEGRRAAPPPVPVHEAHSGR